VSELIVARMSCSVGIAEVLEPGEAQRQHRDQALAAGQDLGVVTVLAQQRHEIGDRLGRVVLERGRLHRGDANRT
jgi:hypothetical protein